MNTDLYTQPILYSQVYTFLYKANRLERASFSSSEHLGVLGHKRGPLWI